MLIDYLKLRRLIGYIGVLLPVVLMAGKAIMEPGPLPGSISDYYYTIMRNILVGAMCAIGVFLSTYLGYQKDYIPVRIAAVSAVGVALFPTVPQDPTTFNNVIGIFHGSFAALFFLSLAYVSLFIFTRGDVPTGLRTPRKKERDLICRVCGFVMAGALVMIPLLTRIPALAPVHPMFWLETLAVEAFGISWLTKGQAILGDKDGGSLPRTAGQNTRR